MTFGTFRVICGLTGAAIGAVSAGTGLVIGDIVGKHIAEANRDYAREAQIKKEIYKCQAKGDVLALGLLFPDYGDKE